MMTKQRTKMACSMSWEMRSLPKVLCECHRGLMLV